MEAGGFSRSNSMLSRRLLSWALFLAFLLPGRVYAQFVDDAVLNSTVLISSQVDSPGPMNGNREPLWSRGTGFLIFKNLGYMKGQVYLITNKHLLPHEGPPGEPKDIKVRVVVRGTDGSSRVEDVSLPVVGA